MVRIFSRERVCFVCLCLCDIYFFQTTNLVRTRSGDNSNLRNLRYIFFDICTKKFSLAWRTENVQNEAYDPAFAFFLFRHGYEGNSSKFLAAVQLSNISRSIVVLFDGKLLEVIKITVMAECRGGTLILKDCIVHKQYIRRLKKNISNEKRTNRAVCGVRKK